MPLNETQIKAKIKAKLLLARNNTTSADESLDNLIDAIYEVVIAILTDAVVTGICGGAGSPLTLGKIT